MGEVLAVNPAQLVEVLQHREQLNAVAPRLPQRRSDRLELAEGGELREHEQGAQARPALAVEFAQGRGDDEAQPHAEIVQVTGGQDDVNRGGLFLELAEANAVFFEVAAHGDAFQPVGLRDGGRYDAGDFLAVAGE